VWDQVQVPGGAKAQQDVTYSYSPQGTLRTVSVAGKRVDQPVIIPRTVDPRDTVIGQMAYRVGAGKLLEAEVERLAAADPRSASRSNGSPDVTAGYESTVDVAARRTERPHPGALEPTSMVAGDPAVAGERDVVVGVQAGSPDELTVRIGKGDPAAELDRLTEQASRDNGRTGVVAVTRQGWR
jgi:hypothetical protein